MSTERTSPELPEGYTWDHSTSPSCIRGPHGFLKHSGGGSNQAARTAWAHYEGTRSLCKPMKISYRRSIFQVQGVDLPGWTRDDEAPVTQQRYVQDVVRTRLRHYCDDYGASHPWLVRAAVLLGVTL